MARLLRMPQTAANAVDASASDADALCNMVKVFASEEVMKVAQHAMELHGGNGSMLTLFGFLLDSPGLTCRPE